MARSGKDMTSTRLIQLEMSANRAEEYGVQMMKVHVRTLRQLIRITHAARNYTFALETHKSHEHTNVVFALECLSSALNAWEEK
jgi:riboflavin synthase alpha subunit